MFNRGAAILRGWAAVLALTAVIVALFGLLGTFRIETLRTGQLAYETTLLAFVNDPWNWTGNMKSVVLAVLGMFMAWVLLWKRLGVGHRVGGIDQLTRQQHLIRSRKDERVRSVLRRLKQDKTRSGKRIDQVLDRSKQDTNAAIALRISSLQTRANFQHMLGGANLSLSVSSRAFERRFNQIRQGQYEPIPVENLLPLRMAQLSARVEDQAASAERLVDVCTIIEADTRACAAVVRQRLTEAYQTTDRRLNWLLGEAPMDWNPPSANSVLMLGRS